MFTGIITHIGTVTHIRKSGDWIFTIAAEKFTNNMAIGASVAHNGACLTILTRDKNGFTVQVSQETLDRTTLGNWRKGTRINLERALKAGDELGGHFVTGHVDGLGTLLSKKPAGESMKLDFSVPVALSRSIAQKGSVTIDGVSLTVNSVAKNRFSVNIIPHTLSQTMLGRLKKGDTVNIEIDVIARYLARLKQA